MQTFAIVAALAAVRAAGAAPIGPSFSWDTIPAFFHS